MTASRHVRPLARFAIAALAAGPLALAAPQDRPAASVAPDSPLSDAPRVIASFYPLRDFAARLAGPLARVEGAAPDGTDPATWRPDRAAIRSLQQADLVLVNGANFEPWLDHVSLPASRLVVTTKPLRDSLIQLEAVTHRHGPEGEHTHEGIDGHTWLDPLNAKAQAGEVYAALVRLTEPDEAALRGLDERRRALDADLESLDAALRELAPLAAGRPLAANHPAYHYLARRYGLAVVDLHLDPEAPPDAATLDAARERLAGATPACLLWESAPAPAVEQAVRDRLGVRSVVFSPVESAPAAGDYVAEMRRNVERLGAALREGAGD